MTNQPLPTAPLARYLLHLADDQLVMGHRNSEWTGLGPILEEDIAFSSIAQDQVGHALAFYEYLNQECGLADPDQTAFNRPESLMVSSWLVEQPIGDYAFSLVRHWCYDQAVYLRYESLSQIQDPALQALATKLRGEVKYHTFHANTWMKSLLQGSEESRLRMLTALKEVWPMALGLFESWSGEKALMEQVGHAGQPWYPGERHLQQHWQAGALESLVLWSVDVEALGLHKVEPVLGGRQGYHSEHLASMLEEMTAVFRLDPQAEW
ncbi:MAG: phenylacetate-CoA oxygenase subunit PaaC [Sphingomonadales bacterium]|nr:phenylacetate-CoA oxygenase subunit PaaC [Sphingomonadales bacterium]